jgi:L-ectoine synthase
MIVRTKDDLKGTRGEIRAKGWSSFRFLHTDDGMGVTLTDAVLEPGLDQIFWYKNHLESVYCNEGEGLLEDLTTGKTVINPGTLYALDKYDRHLPFLSFVDTPNEAIMPRGVAHDKTKATIVHG